MTWNLSLEGELTLYQAAPLKDLLLASLKKADQLNLSLENITAVDLSFAQMVCSLHKEAHRQGKSIALDPTKFPAVFQELLDKAGFQRTSGCLSGADGTCLWPSPEEKKMNHG